MKATIQRTAFGKLSDGTAVELFTLRNANGLVAKITNYGTIITELHVPDRNGNLGDIVLGFDNLAQYLQGHPCFGCTVGRVANRIARGRFVLDGKTYALAINDGLNHLHGGLKGFDKVLWQTTPLKGAAVKFAYTSPDGEEGYPGGLDCTVAYELNLRNEWKMDYTARTDKPTVVNLSNHAYWNLAGAQSGTVLDQVLTLNADRWLLVDGTLIPTGDTAPVQGTPLDFRTPHTIGERIGQIQGSHFNGGYDHCLVLNHKEPGDVTFCARLADPKSGRTMEVFTTEPGVQIYSANFPSGAIEGPHGYAYPKHAGLCLETQHYPDSPNHPQFPSTVLRPGQIYHSTTIHKFGVEK